MGVLSANNDDNFLDHKESNSDVGEDNLGEEFWDTMEREEDEDNQGGIYKDDIGQDFIQCQRDQHDASTATYRIYWGSWAKAHAKPRE